MLGISSTSISSVLSFCWAGGRQRHVGMIVDLLSRSMIGVDDLFCVSLFAEFVASVFWKRMRAHDVTQEDTV